MSEVYDSLKFVESFLTYVDSLHHAGVSAEFQYVAALETYKKSLTEKQLAAYCRGVVNDILLVTADWGVNRVADADKALISAGAPSLSAVRFSHFKGFDKLAELREIKSPSQYRKCLDVLSDYRHLIEPSILAKFESLVAAYESKRLNK